LSTFGTRFYHYNIQDHGLEQIKEGDYSVSFAKAAIDQEMIVSSPISFVWSEFSKGQNGNINNAHIAIVI